MRKRWTPHPYQTDIVAHECGVGRGAVFAGMGTGKTAATLTAIDAIQMGDPYPALVLAPLRVAQSTWPDEATKWEHLSGVEVQPVVGDAKARERALRNGNASVFTINYENIPWLVDRCSERWPFSVVVADESTKLKSFRTRQGGSRARAIGRIAHTKIQRWLNLTGTPAPNGLADLWGQSYFLDAGERLGRSFSAFEQRWFHPDYSGYGMIPNANAQEEIEAKLADICLTVEGLPVDKPIVNVIDVELPARARALYRDMERAYFAMLSAQVQIDAASAGVKSQKLLQFASGAVYDEEGKAHDVHDAKLQALESVIGEAAGMPVLVAYHYKASLSRLRQAFPRGRAFDTNPQTLRDWNAGKIPVLFAHPASAGHGLNLQDGGNILAFFDVDWNLEHHDQIIERIGPMRQKQAGHNRPVFVHYILARDTIDHLVVDRLRNKRDIQAVLLEALRRRG